MSPFVMWMNHIFVNFKYIRNDSVVVDYMGSKVCLWLSDWLIFELYIMF